MITVGFLRLDLVEALSQLLDLLGLPVDALLPETLLLLGILHLYLGAASFGSQLEKVRSSASGLLQKTKEIIRMKILSLLDTFVEAWNAAAT